MSPRYQSGLLQPPSRLSIVGPSRRIIMPMGSQLSTDFSQQQWNNMVAKQEAPQYNNRHRSLSGDNQQPTVS
ncbi:hypothetical protein DPMN_033474 [Dreissena polymorpha]|uniref:Uncharacterized protein n=1 Tax=Dreissena polymorpha TaxID=45954 RepID=A0A9D4M3Q4_DREPO|nr:hypothetical protein DPMN_033474 [Dreissena polymorpha]